MFIDIVGLVGVLQIVIAYFLLQSSYLTSDSYTFSFLNLIGAVFILYSLFYNWNLSSVVIEIIWILISVVGILNKRKKNRLMK
jgi:hypothetical protein